MTTVIAIQHEDDVLLGWDGMSAHGNEAQTWEGQKVWSQRGIVFAIAGVTRIADVIMSTEFPDYDGSDARFWIITKLVPALTKAVQGQTGLVDPENGSYQFGLIVVVDGTAFHIDGLGSPTQTKEGLYGIGSGSDYAKGAVVAGAHLMDALAAAAGLDIYTSYPLTVAWASELIVAEKPWWDDVKPAKAKFDVTYGYTTGGAKLEDQSVGVE